MTLTPRQSTLLAFVLVAFATHTQAFAPLLSTKVSDVSVLTSCTVSSLTVSSTRLFAEGEEDTAETDSSPSAKMSLEEKMKAWEATEEEVKAATLGGIVPGSEESERSDAFDVGLYILFPFMVLSGLAFALFPFIMGNIDVDSVGPPPTN